MMDAMAHIDGVVERLRCETCGATFVNFVFAGDTDMATEGLIAASVCGEDALIVAKAQPAEWLESGEGNHALIEARLSALLARPTRVPRLARVEMMKLPTGLPFPQFREAWREPKCFYKCIRCEGGESHVVQSLEVADYQAAGGTVHFYV